ncbi:TetR/AcrR family transcriptional regulator [Conexibacter sp. DBS9H8]|uniref:TetR/AcrR family transcriptional regulator n=1 Tax=Conexibacter sp. DBS9H8 TaxID=2937801 RepID=UPI00200CF4CB|nr:TetR/AcrR family transcriptional regulator [Conexibacter sp. DBS9H8]
MSPAASERPSRQSDLLGHLLDLFLAEGFAGFTLADLADRLHCSKSTLYGLGHSKESLTVNVVVAFFRQATEAVEAATAAQSTPPDRLVAYLRAVAKALRPASAVFMADLAAHPGTAAVYQQNTELAARRVGELIEEGITGGAFRPVHGALVADVAAATMRRIQTGALGSATGMGDADAYDALADLILHGVSA